MAARAVGWGRNPLRRRTDRVGYAARLTALALAVGALLIAVPVGALNFRHVMSTVDAQAAASRQVTATLTQDAPDFVSLGNRPATDVVSARWTFARRVHHGLVTVAEGSAAGATTRIWVNPAGDQIHPPLTPADARLRGWLVGAAAFAAALVVLLVALRLVEWRLDRARMRLWDREWRRMAPRWPEKTG